MFEVKSIKLKEQTSTIPNDDLVDQRQIFSINCPIDSDVSTFIRNKNAIKEVIVPTNKSSLR